MATRRPEVPVMFRAMPAPPVLPCWLVPPGLSATRWGKKAPWEWGRGGRVFPGSPQPAPCRGRVRRRVDAGVLEATRRGCPKLA